MNTDNNTINEKLDKVILKLDSMNSNIERLESAIYGLSAEFEKFVVIYNQKHETLNHPKKKHEGEETTTTTTTTSSQQQQQQQPQQLQQQSSTIKTFVPSSVTNDDINYIFETYKLKKYLVAIPPNTISSKSVAEYDWRDTERKEEHGDNLINYLGELFVLDNYQWKNVSEQHDYFNINIQKLSINIKGGIDYILSNNKGDVIIGLEIKNPGSKFESFFPQMYTEFFGLSALIQYSFIHILSDLKKEWYITLWCDKETIKTFKVNINDAFSIVREFLDKSNKKFNIGFSLNLFNSPSIVIKKDKNFFYSQNNL
ncbi:hypothetical protein ACTFIW_011957 [Dictyostelium discoideum]